MRGRLFIAVCLLAACGPKSRSSKTLDPNDAAAIKERAVAEFDRMAADADADIRDSKPGKPKDPPPPPLSAAPEAPPSKVTVGEKDKEGCTWVESEGLVVVSENESTHQARAAAVSEARTKAMQEFLGVDVRTRFLDFQQEGLRDQQSLTESILQTTRQGKILKEEVLVKGRRDMPGCEGCRYYVKIKVCLAPVAANADKDFHVELKLSRIRFEEGDEAKIMVTPTRDAYIYLYDVGMDWETALLVPNEFVPEAPVKAGQVFEYPNDEARRNGVKLVAQLPESRPPVSAETIRVIASKVPLSKAVIDASSGGYLGVLRRVNASKSDWTEDAQAFTIYPK